MISSLCDSVTNTGACTAAIASVNTMCIRYLNIADDRACSGTCNTQLSTATAVCANSVS